MNVTLVHNGKLFKYNITTPKDELLTFTPVMLTNSVLGAGKSKTVDIFPGSITDFNIWSTMFDDNTAVEWTKCEKLLKGNEFDWSLSLPTLYGTQIQDIDEKTICRPTEPGLVIVPEKLSYKETQMLCGKFNSVLYAVKGNETRPVMVDMANNLTYRGCIERQMLWAGFTDEAEGGIFVNEANEILATTEFHTGEPNGGDIENCAVLDIETLTFKDVACDGLDGHFCGFCMLEEVPIYKLRGPIAHMELDREYFWTKDLVDNRYVFRGIQNNQILYNANSSQWTLTSIKSRKIYLFLQNAHYPFGKHEWFSPETKDRFLLSFDRCNDEEYNCDDGTCIDMSNRCNGRHECYDHSDEFDCRFIELPESYKIEVPPLSADNNDYLIISFDHLEIDIIEIKDTQSIISVQLGLFSSWKDARLLFVNLVGENHTALNTNDLNQIWRPKFTMYKTTSDNMEEDVSFRELTALPLSPGELSPIEDVIHKVKFPGKDVSLTLRQWFRSEIICQFSELENFPFDENVCTFEIQLYGSSQGWSLPEENLRLKINFNLNFEAKDKGLYRVENQTSYINRVGALEIQILLRRKFAGVFLQNALPNMLLSIIVYATNLYYMDTFDAAITVNVTCLLAMSGLFIAVFQSLPKTPNIKIIDMLQIKSIFLSVIITLLQTMVIRLMKNSKEKKMKKEAWQMVKERVKMDQYLNGLELMMVYILPSFGFTVDILFIVFGFLYENGIYSFSPY